MLTLKFILKLVCGLITAGVLTVFGYGLAVLLLRLLVFVPKGNGPDDTELTMAFIYAMPFALLLALVAVTWVVWLMCPKAIRQQV